MDVLSHPEREVVLDAVRYLGDLQTGDSAIRWALQARGWPAPRARQAMAEVVILGLVERSGLGLRLTRLGSAFLDPSANTGNLTHMAGLMARARWIERIARRDI